MQLLYKQYDVSSESQNGAFLVAQWLKNFPTQEIQETWAQSLCQDDPLEEDTVSDILPGGSHEQRSLAGYSPLGHKESDMTEATELTYTHAFTV